MHSTLIQMSLLMAGGVVWQVAQPMGLSAEQTRKVLTTVVYYFFLPAMILEVLWTADIGLHSLQYTALGVVSVLSGMLCLWIVGLAFKFEHKCMGAMILAAAFPNVTYLGLPVLEQTFGPWARSVVIQLDLFAISPLLFTLGIVVVRHYGEDNTETRQPLWSFLNTPPFWGCWRCGAAQLEWIGRPPLVDGKLKALIRCSRAINAIFFRLGIKLAGRQHTKHPLHLATIVIKMILLPLFAIILVDHFNMPNNYKAAVVLDLAMPSMVLGIVLCDRYQLDRSLYAMAVTVTTALSLISLPFWYQLVLERF